MMHGIDRRNELGFQSIMRAGIEVTCELREITATYFYPQSVLGSNP